MEIPITHSQSQLTTQSWGLSPTNQQPPLFLHFFCILSPAPGGEVLYHFLLEVVPFQSIFVQTWSFFLSFFLSSFFGPVAFRILVPQPGTKLAPFAVEACSPNHWTDREFPSLNIILKFVICLSLSFNTSQSGQECGGLTSLLHTPKGLLCSPAPWPQAPGTSHDPEYSILNDKCSLGIYVELKDTRWM